MPDRPRGNMELVASLPKPDGFFDPEGSGRRSRRRRKQPRRRQHRTTPQASADTTVTGPSSPTRSAAGLNFANSDLAFSGSLVFIGNFNGFNTYDIETPKKPQLFASVVCPGGQGDVSVHGTPAVHVGRADARPDRLRHARASPTTVSAGALPRRPDLRHQRRQEAEADRGRADVPRIAHAHARGRSRRIPTTSTSTAPARARSDPARSWPAVRARIRRTIPTRRSSASTSFRCRLRHPKRPASSIGRGSLPTPGPAPCPASGQAAITGRARRRRRLTNQCHDITVFPEIGLAAGACSGNGILLDISDPVHPVRLDQVADNELCLLALGDVQQRRHQSDLHGRVGRRHAAALPRHRSADMGRRRDLRHRRSQAAVRAATSRCRRRRPSRRIASRTTDRSSRCRAATSWRRRGTRAAFRSSTSPTRPIRSRSPSSIAGRSTRTKLITGGFWSAYWYNGNIYGTEIARGLDVFKLTPSEYLSQNEIDAASLVHSTEFNAQAPATDYVAADIGRRSRVSRSARRERKASARRVPRR